MTPRERTLAVLDRRVPDKLPIEVKMVGPLLEAFTARTGSDDPAEYYGMDVRDVYFAPPTETADFSRYYPEGVPHLWSPPGWEVGEWGVGSTPGSLLHFIHIEHPLKHFSELSELREYPFPDLTKPERHQHLESDVKALHDRGLFAIGFMEWTIFELAWHMRGMDNLFMDLAFGPEFATYLLDVITETRCFQARRFAESGVDMLKIGDDLGTQISTIVSPEMYRQWFQPRHAAVIKAARDVNPNLHVCYHSDGAVWTLLPDFIDAGITVLNPVQPECLDIAAVKKEFGKDLVFWGGIGTQTTMPFDTPEKVYETVTKAIDTLGPTGYLPCPTHVLEPEVPFENIEAYLKAVDDYKL